MVRLCSRRRHLRTARRPRPSTRNSGASTAGAGPYESTRSCQLLCAQPRERDVLPGWSSDQWRSWKTNWWDDAKSSRDPWQDPFYWATSKMGYHGASQFSWVHCELINVEEGCFAMDKNHRPHGGKIGQQGDALSGLDGVSLCGQDLLGSSFAGRRCGIDFEGFGCQGWLDAGGRIQVSLAGGTLQCGKRLRRVFATVHNKEVGAYRGSVGSSSRDVANDHLGYSIEGRGTVDKAVGAESQHAPKRQHGAR